LPRSAAYTIFAAPENEETTDSRPLRPIVAETSVDIPEASVSDAVMMLDLRNTNALMFRNPKSGHIQHGLSPGRRNHRLGRTVIQVTTRFARANGVGPLFARCRQFWNDK
jgi:hypothetical protein